MILLAASLMYLVRISGSMTGSVYATEGETVFLQCNTSAVNPVEWQYGEDIIFGSNGVQNDKYKPRFGRTNSTTLVLYNATVNDSGHYVCFESSGDVAHDISLSVGARIVSEATSRPTAETNSTTDVSEEVTAAKQGASVAWEIIITLIVLLVLIIVAFVSVKIWKKFKSPHQLKRFELKALLPPAENALPLIVDVTTEPCCVSGDSCRRKQAKMPCGHVISPEALKYKCLSDVNVHHLWQFRCPLCPFVWDFTIIRHVLRTIMKPVKLHEIAEQMSENFLQQRDRFRECPLCKFQCERIAAESEGCANPDKVVCVACTIKNNNRPVEFCWRCLRPWASTDGPAAGSACGNADCSVDEVSPENIAAFPDQRMGNVTSAPGIRACPRCSVFVSLAADGYKHVKCVACKLEFCMVCLRVKDGEGRWQCSECDGPCEPAAQQPEFLNRSIDILNGPIEQPTANNNNSS